MAGTAATTEVRPDPDRRGKTMLSAAVSHPTRTQCFTILAGRVASPAEIARELRIDVTTIGYHVRTLRAWGLIEEVDQRPVRGSVEHFYRAVQNPEISDEEEATLANYDRRHFAETILSFYCADAIRSLDAEVLYRRTDHCLTRYAFDVDEEGWEEAAEAYRECWAKVKAIRVRAAERLEEKNAAQADEKPMRMLSYLSLFELPPGAD